CRLSTFLSHCRKSRGEKRRRYLHLRRSGGSDPFVFILLANERRLLAQLGSYRILDLIGCKRQGRSVSRAGYASAACHARTDATEQRASYSEGEAYRSAR